jgi:hypothetical protein
MLRLEMVAIPTSNVTARQGTARSRAGIPARGLRCSAGRLARILLPNVMAPLLPYHKQSENQTGVDGRKMIDFGYPRSRVGSVSNSWCEPSAEAVMSSVEII